MDLKIYQKRVVDEVERYLRALADERDGGNKGHGSFDAWKKLRLAGRYQPRENGLGEDLPTFCIKVPTGGGKTLLATQALGSMYRTILRDRGGAGGGAGLALWVVPSSQIYADTLRRLRDRTDMYRIMLEHAASRRVEVWEKDEIPRLSPARLKDCLNILVLQLASTNRETKEQLKFFRDSGGNIVDHFPPEDDARGHKALKVGVPNLDMVEDDDKAGRHLVKTSIGNLVRLCRPPVILDEGHKAVSELARSTIEGFNAAIVVELSATPAQGTNIISRVTGAELLDEEMIKLPLNVKTSGKKKWQDVVTEARDKRLALAKAAEKHASETGEPLIRPIVLVQVQRTGKDQKGPGIIHADDVKEHLLHKLDVPEKAIAIKSSSKDDIEGLDLMDEGCAVEWIITKSALQEGWDCPFAYILVSLDNTGSGRAMTQLVGRVLRQPFQKRVAAAYGELNQSYAYCLHTRPTEVLKQVKTALEHEGYEGEAQSMVRAETGAGAELPARVTRWRGGIGSMYTSPFEGKIYLPRFCVKDGEGYEPLDYFRHLLSRVDVSKFAYAGIDWDITAILKEQRDRLFKVTLGADAKEVADTKVDLWESDESVRAWMAANLDFPHFSQKQLRLVVDRVYERLIGAHLTLRGRFALVKTEIRKKVADFVQDEVDEATKEAFGALFDKGAILFYLHCEECRFEIPPEIRIESRGGEKLERLEYDNGDDVQRSLFDFVERAGMNNLERQVALVLDRDSQVLWWYRNKVGEGSFLIQGYRRAKVYPDFVVQGSHNGRPFHRVMVIESKGEHLEGNADTAYKREIASYFERAGEQVTWQQLGEPFKDHVFRFQVIDERGPNGADWSDELTKLLRA